MLSVSSQQISRIAVAPSRNWFCFYRQFGALAKSTRNIGRWETVGVRVTVGLRIAKFSLSIYRELILVYLPGKREARARFTATTTAFNPYEPLRGIRTKMKRIFEVTPDQGLSRDWRRALARAHRGHESFIW